MQGLGASCWSVLLSSGDSSQDRWRCPNIEQTHQDRDEVQWLLQQLSDRDALLLRLRFGLDEPRCTLREIGEGLGFQRERARQIESEALDELRRFSSTGMSSYLLRELQKEEREQRQGTRTKAREKKGPSCPPFDPGVVLEDW